MSLPDAIARETAASPRWLSIVGIGEDGVDGLSAAARGLIGAAEIVYRRAPAPEPCGAADPRRGAALAEPVRRRRRRGAAPSRTPGVRARLRRSVPLWRRRHARAPHRCARDARGAGAVGIQPRRGAARLVAAADRAALGPWPHPRSGAPASAARRAHPGADLRWRGRRRRWRSFWQTSASAPRGSRCSKRSAARASESAPRPRRRFDLGAVDALNTVAIEVEAAPGARVIARTAGLRR